MDFTKAIFHFKNSTVNSRLIHALPTYKYYSDFPLQRLLVPTTSTESST